MNQDSYFRDNPQLQGLFDANIIGMALVDLQGKLLKANDLFLTIMHVIDKDWNLNQVIDLKSFINTPKDERMHPIERVQTTSPSERNSLNLSWAGEDYILVYLNEEREPSNNLVENSALKEEQFKLMVDQSPVMTFMHDENRRLIYINEILEKAIGYTIDEIQGENWFKTIHPDDWGDDLTLWFNAFNNRLDFQTKYRLLTKDGSYRWVQLNARPIFAPGGHFIGYIGVVNDINEMEVEKKVREEVIRKKDEFLNSVSHELRTPITSIKASLQVSQQMLNSSQQEKAKQFLDKSLSYLNKLSELVANLLEISRIESGKLVLQYERFTASELLDAAFKQAKNLNFPLENLIIEGNFNVTLEADKERLCHALSNLVSNAIKYSSPEKKVTITGGEQNENFLLSVSDQGVGISRDIQAHIFDRFYRVRDNFHVSGLGLGLYLTFQIIQHHGGTLDIQSKPGKGSVFSLKIPLKNPGNHTLSVHDPH